MRHPFLPCLIMLCLPQLLFGQPCWGQGSRPPVGGSYLVRPAQP
jgi:hypothetical protein